MSKKLSDLTVIMHAFKKDAFMSKLRRNNDNIIQFSTKGIFFRRLFWFKYNLNRSIMYPKVQPLWGLNISCYYDLVLSTESSGTTSLFFCWKACSFIIPTWRSWSITVTVQIGLLSEICLGWRQIIHRLHTTKQYNSVHKPTFREVCWRYSKVQPQPIQPYN